MRRSIGEYLNVTIVDHLDIVTRTSLTNPITARFAIGLSCCFLEDLFDCRPSSWGTTRHERRAVACSFFATRDARADEKKTFRLKRLGTADRVGIMGIPTIYNDVTGFQMFFELCDKVIDGGPSLDEEDDLSGLLELRTKLFDRPCPLNLRAFENISVKRDLGGASLLTFGLISEEMIDLGGCPIMSYDCKPFVIHVEYQILTLVAVSTPG
jgi:hypothetical protein